MTTEPGTPATGSPLEAGHVPAHASPDADVDVDVDADDLDDVDEEDLEFQPRIRGGLHWLTLLLIGLALWGAGFLAGVLTDRAVAGFAG